MKSPIIYFSFASFVISILLVGCSVGNKIDKEALGRAKRAAIVGFTIDEREPVSAAAIGKSMLGFGEEDNTGYGKVSFEIKTAKHVDAGYDIAAKTLGERLKITFLPRSIVASNAALKAIYDQKSATFQTGVTPLKPYYERFEAVNIPQAYYVHFADKAALNAIAKSLGVDTLVIISSKTDLSGGVVSKLSSTANISILFYDPSQSEFSTYVNERGASINTQETKIMGFADSNEMHIQSLEAMKSALMVASEKF